MALEQACFTSFEYDRMIVQFSMRDGAKVVPCAISTSAMDELEGAGRAPPSGREAQFMRLRERIEARAVVKYTAGEFEGAPAGIILRSIDFRKP
ncbi:DUF1488 domain-containing protein [Bradyrhizobium sp. WSM 1704]|uniref:DUF1488 family protein n=1 Tax=Bradyrhizobium semiaridum TaxID=2821404 RepID=UPI001CE30B9A|nr:DUF1488 family protein [Bradyrhizobium semiaridum]MCA6124261.1 DUF1488 domain-containing protein [Bradyrhizobium semiaridum]